jgi:hypothetical protein
MAYYYVNMPRFGCVEIRDEDTDRSVAFMQGDDASWFLDEIERCQDEDAEQHLMSQYDYQE